MRQCITQDPAGYASLVGNLAKRHKNEQALEKARMGQGELIRGDADVSKEEQIDIDFPRAPALPDFAADYTLDLLANIKKCFGRKGGFEQSCSVQERRLFCDAPRWRFKDA